MLSKGRCLARDVRHLPRFFLEYRLESSLFLCTFAASKKKSNMSYTKETLVISNPSEKLLKAMEELRLHKREQLEKLRNMKPEEFSRRVILA